MASREELYQALRNADAAGDVAAAQRLSAYIQSMPAASAQSIVPTPQPEKTGTLRAAADIPVQVGRGIAQGVKALSDVFGADNPVSRAASGVEGYLGELLSAQAKNDQAEIARIMKAAEDKGVGEQVTAAVKAFATAPVDMLSQALGTAVPVIAGGLAGSLARLGAAGVAAVGTGVGAAMGAGTVKGQIYDAVKQELKANNVSEAEAEKRAQEAQAYGGKNLDQILMGAGIGAAEAAFGAERILTGLIRKGAVKPSALPPAGRIPLAAATEALPEAAQAAQEQIAQNIALQREGYDVPTMRGVAGQAALEGIAGMGLGVIAGAAQRTEAAKPEAEAPKPAAPAEPEIAEAGAPKPLTPEEQRELDLQQQTALPPEPTAEAVLGEVRGKIQTAPPTTPADIARIRDEHETAVINSLLEQDKKMQGVADMARANIERMSQLESMEAATADADRRVREGRLMARVQSLIDENIPFASTAIADINRKFEMIGESPLDAAERARVQNIMTMAQGFTDFVKLPSMPVREQDRFAENQAMEALIKERKPRGEVPSQPVRAEVAPPSEVVREAPVPAGAEEGRAVRPEAGVEPSIAEDRERAEPVAEAVAPEPVVAEVGAAQPTAVVPESKTPTGQPAGWVLRNKETGEVVMETNDPAKVRALNTEKYEAVPILEYLQGLNKPQKPAAEALPQAEIAKGEEATLWRYNEVTGMWNPQRKVTQETQNQWLNVFQSDDPTASFVVSKKRPTKKPKAVGRVSVETQPSGEARPEVRVQPEGEGRAAVSDEEVKKPVSIKQEQTDKERQAQINRERQQAKRAAAEAERAEKERRKAEKEAEAKRKAEAAAERERAKRKAEEMEAKRKAEKEKAKREQDRRKAEEAEAKRKAEEAEAKRKAAELPPYEQRVKLSADDLYPQLKDFDSAVNAIYDRASNPAEKEIASLIKSRVAQFKELGFAFSLRVTPEGKMLSSGALGHSVIKYSPIGEATTISIALNHPSNGDQSGTRWDTVTHELLHAVTQAQIRFAPEGSAARQLKSLFNDVVDYFNERAKAKTLTAFESRMYNGEINALRNPDELLAWGLSDKNMQSWLNGIDSKKGNFLSRLYDIVANVLGFGKSNTALAELLSVSEALLTEPVDAYITKANLRGKSFGMQKNVSDIPGWALSFAEGLPVVWFEKDAALIKAESMTGKTIYLVATPEGVSRGDVAGYTGNLLPPTRLAEVKGIADTFRSGPEEEIRFMRSAPSPTTAGQSALDTINQLGMGVQPPEPGKVEKIKNTLKNIGENPSLTTQEAKKKFGEWMDWFETKAFSADAKFEADVRRGLKEDMAGMEALIGTMLSVSQSGAVHADAVATQAVLNGRAEYDPETQKWVAVEDKNNITELSRQLEAIADKYGLTKEEAQRVAHTYFVAKNYNGILERNKKTQAQIDSLKEEGKKEEADDLKDTLIFVTPDQEALVAPGLELINQIPELGKMVKTWNNIRQNFVKTLVDSYLWSPEYATAMLDNIDYVPFYREEQVQEEEGPQQMIRGLQVKSKEHKLKGSASPVNDVFDNMARWMQYAMNRAIRNHKALQMVDVATEMKVGDRMMAKKVSEPKRGMNVARVWRGGKQEFYDMADPLYVGAFQSLGAVSIPSIKFFTDISNILRKTVVMYPLFSIGQLTQDSVAAIFASGLKPQHAFKIPFLAVQEFIKTMKGWSTTHDELVRYGVVGVRDFNATVARQDAEITAGIKAPRGAWGKINYMLERIAMSADNAVRQATYIAATDAGLSKAESLEKAFEIINFRRRGSSKLLNLMGQTVPFFYAYLSAQRVAYKTLTGVGISPTERKAALETLAQTTAAVMALSFLYAMANGDDEEYKKTPATVRDRSLIIPGSGGVRIPLRPDFFLFPKVIAEHTYQLITDKGYSDGAKMRKSMADLFANATLSPNVVPQIVKPTFEAAINYSFFEGKPIIGYFEQNKEAGRQFNESTSEFAKWLGRFGASPQMVDHLVRGYFGSVGGLVLWGTNFFIEGEPGVPRPELTAHDMLTTMPGVGAFKQKPTENALKVDFYELRDAIAKAKNTYDDMKVRSPEGLEAFLQDEKNLARLAMDKQVTKVGDHLSKIRRAIQQVAAAPAERISASEKQERIKELRDVEMELLKAVDVKAMRAQAKL